MALDLDGIWVEPDPKKQRDSSDFSADQKRQTLRRATQAYLSQLKTNPELRIAAGPNIFPLTADIKKELKKYQG